MASSSSKEKAVATALRKLNKVFNEKMNGFDVAVGLYGQGKLTFREYEHIRTAKTVPEANSELVSAVHRRGPEILDVLLDVLEDEEEANSFLIQRIREIYNPQDFKNDDISTTTKALPEANKELLGNGTWPAATISSTPFKPPPLETTDYNPKMAYKMTSRPRGVAIIINNRHFTCGMKERIGTDKDAESLTRLFIYLGFYTNRFDNLKGREMTDKIKQIATIDHSKYDCLIVAVLSHGISGKLYSTDGDLLSVEDLTRHFDGLNCPTLIGKPKIFLLQACRGGKFDYGVESESTDLGGDEEAVKELAETNYEKINEKALDDAEVFFHTSVEETDGGGSAGALPVESDFMLAYATVPGYVSWRNSEYGSWFIKAFVDAMFELSKGEHFTDILVEVNRKVANEFQSKGRNKQIPSPVIMLTRKLYFRPGIYN